jgi:ABC-type proline/glycine betaine transport system substrate-binding protein
MNRIHSLALAAAVFAVALPQAAFAQAQSASATISKVRTGWNDDSFALEIDVPLVNPAGCSTPDGYASNIASAGYKTFLSAALMAYGTGKPVTLIVSNTECVLSRPKIIGVYLS